MYKSSSFWVVASSKLLSLNHLAKASGSKHSNSSEIVRNILGKGGKRKRIWAPGKISDPDILKKNELNEMQIMIDFLKIIQKHDCLIEQNIIKISMHWHYTCTLWNCHRRYELESRSVYFKFYQCKQDGMEMFYLYDIFYINASHYFVTHKKRTFYWSQFLCNLQCWWMSADVQQIQLVLSPRAKTTPSVYKCYYPNWRQLFPRNHRTRRRFLLI